MCFILNLQKKNNTWHLFTFRNLPKSLRPKGNAMLAAILILKRKGVYEVGIYCEKYLLTRAFLASMATSCIVGE